jgi:N-acetyl-anhydromuramyl-L-alanine amidase AmpD
MSGEIRRPSTKLPEPTDVLTLKMLEDAVARLREDGIPTFQDGPHIIVRVGHERRDFVKHGFNCALAWDFKVEQIIKYADIILDVIDQHPQGDIAFVINHIDAACPCRPGPFSDWLDVRQMAIEYMEYYENQIPRQYDDEYRRARRLL